MSRLFFTKIKKKLHGVNPDLVIAFEPEGGIMANRIFASRIPIVSMFHNHIDNFQQTIVEFGNELSKTILCVLLPEYAETLKTMLPKGKVVSIANLVPQSDQRPHYENKKIINVARFHYQKRQTLLLDAFKKALETHPDWTLEVWGTSPFPTEIEKVRNQINALGIEDHVFLRGTSHNIEAELKSASIFAFPSAFEGFPLAMTEAMAIGLPVVGCKDCAGVNTLKNGFLTDPTPEEFAKGLVCLMDNIDLREKLGRQAKKDMEEYAPEKIWDQWELLIQECLAK